MSLALSDEHATQFVLDVDADDFFERRFGLEPEGVCPLRIESLRPTGDDLSNRLVRLASYPIHYRIPRDSSKCFDLFTDGDGKSWHG